MTELPVLVGLKVCKDVVVDRKSGHVTLVNCIRRLHVKKTPTSPQNFTVCCVLADGQGEMKFNLRVTDLSTMEPVFSGSLSIHMGMRIEERWMFFNLKDFVFPKTGRYELLLSVNGEWFADSTITVIAEGDQS